ncbi:MAG: hypothetical protein HC788_09090 [Sphingopyxis sp.]|nr:hypothetical protein [Sphingopyxis sp.]
MVATGTRDQHLQAGLAVGPDGSLQDLLEGFLGQEGLGPHDGVDAARSQPWSAPTARPHHPASVSSASFSHPQANADDSEWQPALAARYEVDPTGEVYTFHLRSDVRWHDGTPLNVTQSDFAEVLDVLEQSIKAAAAE